MPSSAKTGTQGLRIMVWIVRGCQVHLLPLKRFSQYGRIGLTRAIQPIESWLKSFGGQPSTLDVPPHRETGVPFLYVTMPSQAIVAWVSPKETIGKQKHMRMKVAACQNAPRRDAPKLYWGRGACLLGENHNMYMYRSGCLIIRYYSYVYQTPSF